LVKQLTALVAKDDPEAARFVHWGATSQDANDTGLVLQIRQALDILEADLAVLCTGLGTGSETPLHADRWPHADAACAANNFRCQGCRLAGRMNRHRERFAETRARVLVLQFGGAVGTLAALREKGLQVAEALAAELNLGLPAMPWHTQRDRMAEVATTLGLCTGTLGKIARDISLHMQTEIAEDLRTRGRGPRRFLDDAAQAQPGECRNRVVGSDAGSRPRQHHAERHGAGG
jgi:3-carboxy-cis,cis-muconate cycloisomerase